MPEDTAKDCKKWSFDNGDSITAVLHVAGEWQAVEEIALPPMPNGTKSIAIDASLLGKWDASLPVSLFKLQKLCKERGFVLETSALPEGLKMLLSLAMSTPAKTMAPQEHIGIFARIGELAEKVIASCRVGLEFIGAILIALGKLLLFRAHMRWKDVWCEIIKAGPDAVFIVSLIGFLMGLILAFIGAIPLKWFRAQLYIASLIGIGMLRLMAAVMTGVVMAGRTGAAFAAELGTMQVNDEIDALQSMGIPPVEFLVLPRLIALTIMMPLLCIYADLIGVIGGMIVGVYYMDLSFLEYWNQMAGTTRLADLFVGLFTSFVFGILISICGCLRGLRCGRSSASVGQATTSAMVSSIICLVISTSIITVVTVYLNI